MPRQSKDKVEQRLIRVSQLYETGWKQYEIAEKVRVSPSQITKDLKKIRQAWKDSYVRDFDLAKAEELAKIDGLERTYWDAWERSKTAKTRRSVRQKGQRAGAVPEDIEMTDTTEESIGDVSFLRGIQWCINKRCEILGLDAPVKSISEMQVWESKRDEFNPHDRFDMSFVEIEEMEEFDNAEIIDEEE